MFSSKRLDWSSCCEMQLIYLSGFFKLPGLDWQELRANSVFSPQYFLIIRFLSTLHRLGNSSGNLVRNQTNLGKITNQGSWGIPQKEL